MKIFKFVLKILLVFIFVFSLVLNIVLYNSSYGSLLFKYDENKFLSMNGIAQYKITADNFLSQRDSGIQIKIVYDNGNQEINGSSNYTYKSNQETKCYIDQNLNLNCKYINSGSKVISGEIKDFSNEVYYKEGYLYSNDGETKTKVQKSSLDAFSSFGIAEVNAFALNDDTIKAQDIKTKINFSFSPFYFIGITYSYTLDSGSTYRYNYDLNGNLRKIEVSEKANDKVISNYTITISYKSKKVSFPDFKDYKEN